MHQCSYVQQHSWDLQGASCSCGQHMIMAQMQWHLASGIGTGVAHARHVADWIAGVIRPIFRQPS